MCCSSSVLVMHCFGFFLSRHNSFCIFILPCNSVNDLRVILKNKFYKMRHDFFFAACSSKPTLQPNMDFLSVHMGDNVTIYCTGGPGASGTYHSHLKWELANGETFPGNVETLHLEDRHRSNITCDVERLSITLFAKDNKGEYRCICNDTTSSHSTSTAVRIDMIGKSISIFCIYMPPCRKEML